jgi:hypothetical protein
VPVMPVAPAMVVVPIRSCRHSDGVDRQYRHHRQSDRQTTDHRSLPSVWGKGDTRSWRGVVGSRLDLAAIVNGPTRCRLHAAVRRASPPSPPLEQRLVLLMRAAHTGRGGGRRHGALSPAN